MCGRYTLAADPQAIADQFGIEPPARFAPRYSIAPTQPVLIVQEADERRVAHLVRWGLIPSWAKDAKIGNRLINARAETVAEKPAFRAALRRRRCLVPASGYYEWAAGPRGKQPWYVHAADGNCLALAGIWEHWEHDGAVIESCAIITCAANARLATVHDRMPVVIARPDYARWLAPERAGPAPLELLRPAADDAFALYPVSTRVNSPRHDAPDCIEPLPTPR